MDFERHTSFSSATSQLHQPIQQLLPSPHITTLSASDLARRALNQLGDLNHLFERSRLLTQFEQQIKFITDPKSFDLNTVKQILQKAPQNLFELMQQTFIKEIKNQCKTVLTKVFYEQLSQFEKGLKTYLESEENGLVVQNEDEVLLPSTNTVLQTFKYLHEVYQMCHQVAGLFPQNNRVIMEYEIKQSFQRDLNYQEQIDMKLFTRALYRLSFYDYEGLVHDRLKAQGEDSEMNEDGQEWNAMQYEQDYEEGLYNGQQAGLLEEYQEQLGQIQELTRIMIELGWEDNLEYSLKHLISNHIQKNLGLVKNVFSQPYLKKLQSYFQAVLIRWINAIYNNESLSSKWMIKTETIFMIEFVKLRTSEMFALFQEFPESLPAINDLKNALEKTKLHQYFTTQVKEQFQSRLLLPGQITLLIIEHYIQAIRVLKLLDPSTILLEIISEPIKEHLRKRSDTLRCIVQSILADQSELYEQLGQAYVRIPIRGQRSKQSHPQPAVVGAPQQPPKPVEDNQDDDDDYISSDEDEAAAENWEPLPLQNDMKDFFISAKRKKTDIISTLVNIYGSQDAFLKVYKSMLEERLLSGGAEPSERRQLLETELKNLELMKLRFGQQQTSLHACDVMMRDIKDSERIRQAIIKSIKPTQQQSQALNLPILKLNTCIVSKGYWDSMQAEDTDSETTAFAPPPFLKKSYEEFAAKYQQFKRMRTVNFKPNLGQVQLTLDFQNGSFKFKVTPLQATIISLFNSNSSKSLSADQIAKELDISAEDVRRKGVAFWVCRGVLREQKIYRQLGSSHYRSNALLSNQDIDIVYSSVDVLELKGLPADTLTTDGLIIEANEVADSANSDPQLIRIQQVQNQDDDKLVRSFILNIISNSPTLGCSIDKIYTMLRNVYMAGQNIQRSGLEELLFKMTSEEKIAFNGQIYTLYSK